MDRRNTEHSMARIKIFDRHWHLPKSKPIRIGFGILLIALGLLGFLPVLGFWMIPLGLVVLSVDLPIVRRWRRQFTVWWHRKRDERKLRREARENALRGNKGAISDG
jgi:hypothetical protein